MILLLIGLILLALTSIHPHDYPTWWMETAPIFIAVPILLATFKSYRLTPLTYRLLFIHALLFRELLLRSSPLKQGKLLFTLVTASCLAISALYELIEWGAAEAMGAGADAFLGTQGYAWDTQSGMLMALLGAMVAQVVLGKVQDKQLL